MRLIDADELKKDLSRFYDGEVTAKQLIDGQPTVYSWISVKERLPPNADHLNAFCPRYFVQTKYGRSEGWYNPNEGCWYTLVWFLIGRYTEDDIDMERGDIPRISNKIEVTNWMPMPEPSEEMALWTE